MQVGPVFIKRVLAFISVLAFGWVVHKLWSFEDWDYFWDHLSQHRSEAISMFAIQLGLLVLNLALESQKWKILVSPIAKISLEKSFSQVLKGIQLGLITPARTGEPVGKAVFFNPGQRTRVMILSFAGSIIQNGVILVSAVLALLFIGFEIHTFNHQVENYYTLFDSWWITGTGLISLTTLFIILKSHPGAVRILKTTQKHLLVFKRYQTKHLVQVTVITVFRYLVFSIQLYLLLRFFGLTNIQNGLLSVFIYYAALSFLPSAGAGDLGVRASVALLIFGQTTLIAPAIVMASLILWFLNLGIPALIPFFSGIPSLLIPKVQNKTLPT